MVSIMMGWVVISKKFTRWCRKLGYQYWLPVAGIQAINEPCSYELYLVSCNRKPVSDNQKPVTGNW